MESFNLIGYAIYLPITFYITIVVGKLCYTHGEIYLSDIILESPETVRFINKVLLTGYYLLNLGYATVTLSFWPNVGDIIQLISALSLKVGQIIFLLGVIHYCNMGITYLLSKHINKQNN